MIDVKQFYYTEHKGDTLDASKWFSLQFGPLPLIWDNAGAYGLIRLEQVANMIDVIEAVTNISKINKPCELVFHWDDAIALDPKVAKILLGVTWN